jgi:hypothetical protein
VDGRLRGQFHTSQPNAGSQDISDADVSAEICAFGTGTLLSSHPGTNFDGKVPQRCSLCGMTCRPARVGLLVLQLDVLDLTVGTTPVGSFHVGATHECDVMASQRRSPMVPRLEAEIQDPHRWRTENSTPSLARPCSGYGG